LIENGSIKKVDHQYVLSKKATEIVVPDTLQAIIAARIDRLEDNLKRTMQVASVIGRDFAFRILQAITGMKEDLKSHLLSLQGLEFIYEKKLFPELEYIFKHALIQEVAYNNMLFARRKEIHGQIGLAIEQIYAERLEEFYELLVYHYSRSDDLEKAAEYLHLANQKAIRFSAMEEAKSYFDQAMKVLDKLPETDKNRERRIALLVGQTYMFLTLFKFPEYRDLLERYEPVAKGLQNQGLVGAFYGRIGHCFYTFGQFDQAIEELTKAAELCEASGNFEGVGHAHGMLSWSHMWRGNYERILALKEETLRKMKHQFHLRWYVWAFVTTAYACAFLGRWDEATENGQKALSVAEEHSDDESVSLAGWVTSWAYTFKGDLKEARRYAELGVNKASTPASKLFSQVALAGVWCRMGNVKEAIEILDANVPIYRAGRHLPSEIMNTMRLGEAYWFAGDYDTSRKVLTDYLRVTERCGARFFSGFTYRLLGEIALKTNLQEAAPNFEKSIGLLKEIKAENELALAYSGYGRFHKQEGNIEGAREHLSKALEKFERLGTLIEPAKVRKELAELRKT
jgi:tetratricopeptide (TPR) repeat protein